MGWQGKQKQTCNAQQLRQVSSPAQTYCQPDKHKMSWKHPFFIRIVPLGLSHSPAKRYSEHHDTVIAGRQMLRKEYRSLPNNFSSEICRLIWYLWINQWSVSLKCNAGRTGWCFVNKPWELIIFQIIALCSSFKSDPSDSQNGRERKNLPWIT